MADAEVLLTVSLTYRIATGTQAGRKVTTLQTLPGDFGEAIVDLAAGQGALPAHIAAARAPGRGRAIARSATPPNRENRYRA